ncbi:nitrate reductase molybdenum cofactor assembly chaperone [Ignavibacteria bacterium CHB1]|nr:hypothetical protein [Ignavibacteria bacterium]MCC6886021.1 nitrate reductase molybdenum cofactor assembly chaperone [Ignavibacteriales bacterium]MCE7952729.1 nitrate reductase molybdenum cofactor assembly chaperone [Chlorobi bacterium CHB7]MDL1886839.1 nitrate reductase molybdenum cofactor assembly chaperone [Ignavibacteria bacterium CHB1]RIK50363.1 MAG: nitrate reductase molybdenum cofactor assembly chaperone [Ignavibacteriota bacterium]
MKDTKAIANTYKIIADLWCNPIDINMEDVLRESALVINTLRENHFDTAEELSKFIQLPAVTQETYIDLFELNPQCALYLGSHTYEESSSCADAAKSDRNTYMIELVNLYKHFGLAIDKNELPDYLPIMVEFLALTIHSNIDPVRIKFINEYMLPFLQPLREKLEEMKSHYKHLCDALIKNLHDDLKLTENLQPA